MTVYFAGMRHTALAALCLAAAASTAFAEASAPAGTIDALLQRYHQAGQLDGVLLVVDGGKTVYRGAFGLANRELDVPNTVGTRFRIGSITKAFTATLVLQLVDRGRLNLHGTVREYLPDYSGPNGDRITLEQLLTHTAGLRDSGDFPRRGNNFPAIAAKINGGFVDIGEYVKLIAEYQPLFEPGSDFRYSNDGYVLLGAILERVTGKRYAQLLDELILIPLGMKNSGMADRAPLLHGRASGYDHYLDGDENAPPVAVLPNGGMYSTVDDLLLFLRAVTTNGLLSQRSRELMFSKTPHIVAYGWKIIDDAGGRTVVADGLVPGFTALAIVARGGDRIIVLLTNTRLVTPKIGDIVTGVVNVLDGKPAAPPHHSGAEAVLATVRRQGVDAALAHYRTLRGDAAYAFDEGELNAAGYLLLGERSTAAAIAILRIATEAYPNSANAFDSLGEAYLAAGDKPAAIAAYTRSLELDPANTNARDVLQRLGAR